MSTDQTRPTHMYVPASIALLFGLSALALCWVPLVGVLAFPFGTVAVAAAAVAIRRTRAPGLGGRSLAITGLVTGAIGLAVATYILVVFLLGFTGPAWQGDVNDLRALFRTEPRY
ncbi:MAG: hypothetical protein ACRDYA_02235 [Egibacteraceae bacterium]